MSGNGQLKAAKAEREKQREHERELETLRGAQIEDLDDEKADLIETVMATDLNEPSKKMLINNLLAGDWTLTKYDAEDLNEIRWELRIFEDMYLVLHPASESVVEGRFRQYVYDSERPRDALETLDEQDIFQIKQIFRGIWSRIKRSDDGFQWEEIGKSRTEKVAITENGGSSSGGILGRLGGK